MRRTAIFCEDYRGACHIAQALRLNLIRKPYELCGAQHYVASKRRMP